MKFIKTKKKLIFFIIFIGVIFIGIKNSSDIASAATNVTVQREGILVCYNWSTGKFTSYHNNTYDAAVCGSNNGGDGMKKIGSNYAYCVQWELWYNGNTYTKVDSWTSGSKQAIISGRIIETVNSKSYNTYEKYTYTGEALNTYFKHFLNVSGASDFYSKNSDIKTYIDDAINWYNTNEKLIKATKLPTISISSNNKSNNIVLKYTSSNYVSDKITISGLVATYGGTSDTVTYTVSATASNGKDVQICTGSNKTGCKTNQLQLSGVSGSKDYYLFVNKNDFTADDTITLKVSGANKSTYPSSVRYKNAVNDGRQDLLTIGEYDVSRTGLKEATFIVPNTVNHRISAYKVDEYGSYLKGATLELYKNDVSVASNLLKSNNGSGYSVSYTSDTVVEDDDDFFSNDYYLVEKSAPDGFVLSSSVTKFYLKDSQSSSNSESCYYNGGNESDESEIVDNERCNFDNYEYKCQSSTGEYLDLNEAGNCVFSSTESEEDGISEVVIESDDNTDDSTSDETEDGNEEETPDTSEAVTYTKICYNKAKNTTADESYCSDKGNYTKVVKTNGNLTVTQPNKRNIIKISKKDISGDEEVAGASLKICTAASYESQKDDCDAAKTIDDVEMSWVSGDSPYEFSGISKGSYYIVEVTPPRGYIKATTATEFSIDEYGDVKTGDKTITNKEFEEGDAIVIENQLTEITISKQDVATSKELPGATISICRTYVDENGDRQLLVNQYTGDCIEAIKADGTAASWVSTNEPKVIKGLPAGTYYLVEKIAPTDYTTAESILFTLKEDGTLVNKDGISLADKKLVMYDKAIEEVKTGSLNTYVVFGIFLVVVGLGVGSYYYLRTSKKSDVAINRKIRKRRIHKK